MLRPGHLYIYRKSPIVPCMSVLREYQLDAKHGRTPRGNVVAHVEIGKSAVLHHPSASSFVVPLSPVGRRPCADQPIALTP
jgi:hypothetical protein